MRRFSSFNRALDWDALPDNVKEVLVDLTYRGDYTGSEDKRGNTRKLIVPAVYKDQKDGKNGIESELYFIIEDIDEVLWISKFNVDTNRHKKRYKKLL